MPVKPIVVVNPPSVAVMVLAEFPCKTNVWPVAPTVRLALGERLFVFTAANVGLAPELIFCTVLTAPLATLKLVPLKLAIPLAAVVASLMVTIEPEPEALATDSAPARPFKLTPPEPLTPQLGQLMLPLTSSVIKPLALTATVPLAFGSVIVLFELAGAANSKELVIPPLVAVSFVLPLPCKVKFWPVAPATKAPLGVIVFVLTPAKVGVALVAMSWTVLTAPAVTLKFPALKLAMPFAAVVASLIVIVLPAPEALAMLSAPDRPFSVVTPPPPGQA